MRQEAGGRRQEPGVRSQEPGARSQEPGARSQEPGGRSQESGARSQEPGARSQEPGARSQESGVRSQEPGARSQEPGVRSQEPGVQEFRSSGVQELQRCRHDPPSVVTAFCVYILCMNVQRRTRGSASQPLTSHVSRLPFRLLRPQKVFQSQARELVFRLLGASATSVRQFLVNCGSGSPRFPIF